MRISNIYKKFQIPPNLQLHMIRVASLALLIADSWKGGKLDLEVIVASCLLHDLGNILKFDFDNFPELLGGEQKNIEYWRKVKKDMQKKYGFDEDIATRKMIRKLSINDKVKFIVENWGFKNFKRIYESNNLEWKICVYSDHRISPNGIVSLEENLREKRKRYSLNKKNASHLSKDFEMLLQSAQKIEEFIANNWIQNLHKITNSDLAKLSEKISLFEMDYKEAT